MSTYYALACNECKVQISFVGRWAGAGWSWMAGMNKSLLIPEFISHHADHLGEVCVISEHDHRYGVYVDLDPDDDEDT